MASMQQQTSAGAGMATGDTFFKVETSISLMPPNY
jgi:hypothetical protein